MALLDLAEAVDHVLAACVPLDPVRWPLREALGCTTAEAVVATEQVPTFDNSAMDGYAVRAVDVATATDQAPVRLAVVDTTMAGMGPSAASVGVGQAVKIMTGAPMPAGADAVVMVERTTPAVDEAGARAVDVLSAVETGASVRRAGDDVRPGDRVVDPGEVLRPAHLGVLAGLGVASVLVRPRPRVGVFSTGDELVDGPWPLGPGQIRDTNRITLCALLERDGFEPVDLGRILDDAGAIEAAIRGGARRCDALVSSGGVSMGDADLVKVVLDRIGDMRWMQIAIKPAKPFAFGTVAVAAGRGTASAPRLVPVFGLPGNPVSSAVSYELLARPGLRKMAGLADEDLRRRSERAVALDGLGRRPDGKTHFARVSLRRRADGTAEVWPSGGQGSHQLSALTAADALAVLPDGDGVAAGDPVEVLVLFADRSR